MEQIIIPFLVAVLPLLAAGAFFWLWRLNTSRIENFSIALGFVLMASGVVFATSALDVFERTSIGIVLVILGLATCAFCWGILRRKIIDPPLHVMLLICLFGFACATLLRVTNSDIGIELLVASGTLGVVWTLSAQLFGQSRSQQTTDNIIFWIMVFTAAQCFVQPVIATTLTGTIAAEPVFVASFYTASFSVCGILGLVLAIASFVAAYQDHGHDVAKAASFDGLTALLMRGPFEQAVEELIKREKRTGSKFSLIVCDLDNFKQVNDNWGHTVGDRVIQCFAGLIKSSVRAGDVCGRIGGEEFCIFLESNDPSAATGLANRLCVEFSKERLEGLESNGPLTASFGVAEMRTDESYANLFERADAALYKAKSNGKNQVCDLDQEVDFRAHDVLKARLNLVTG